MQAFRNGSEEPMMGHSRLRAVGIALVALMLLARGTVAQEPTTLDDILAKFAESKDEVKSWSADMDMLMSVMGMEMKYQGTLIGKGAQMKGTMSMDILGNQIETSMTMDKDSIMWMEMDMSMLGQGQMVMKMDMKQVIEMGREQLGAFGSSLMGDPSSAMMQDPSAIIAGLQDMYALEFTGSETLDDGAEVYILQGAMNDDVKESMSGILEQAGMSMDRIRIALGKDDGFPREVSHLDASDNPVMKILYRNVRINLDVDDSVFDYTPPEGAQVMDMSGMMAGNLDALNAPALGGQPSAQPEYNTKMKVGEMAPAFDGAGFPSGTISLSDYEGKVVLLDFWATWCAPCIAELPNVLEVYAEFHPKGLEILGISLDSSDRELTKFLKENPKMDWAQIFDGKAWDSDVGKLYGVEAIPFTLLLDGTGEIRYKDLRGEALGEAVKALLEETGQE